MYVIGEEAGAGVRVPLALSVLLWCLGGGNENRIEYGAGGFNIKCKTARPRIKRDCGDINAFLGAFHAALEFPKEFTLGQC